MAHIEKGRIAKNTLMLYFRMILVMLVTIYTSRVVLDKLGVDDYGLYNAVASVTAMMSFLTSTLSTSTSRFITYSLGQNDVERQRHSFSTSFYTHLILAAIFLLLLETIGLWYLNNKFVISSGREFAVHIVYQISIFSAAISILQVPFTASVIAHEQMKMYAYVGVFDVFLRLSVVYLLAISPFDKLVYYALLIAVVHIVVGCIYVIFCLKNNNETRCFNKFSSSLLNEMMGFSGWTLLANLSNTLMVQGPVVLLNLFCQPAIIASKALASQVSSALMQFVSNFRSALNPQIIKSYAAGEHQASKKLTLQSVVITFDLLLFLGLPCILTMKTILGIWLVEVPPLAVEFSQIAIATQILSSISSSTYIPFVASGKLKVLSLVSVPVSILSFALLYVILKSGGTPLWTQYVALLSAGITLLILRPLLLCSQMNYNMSEILKCYIQCFKTLFLAIIPSGAMYCLIEDNWWQQIILFICTAIFVVVSAYMSLDRNTKNYVKMIVKRKVGKI